MSDVDTTKSEIDLIREHYGDFKGLYDPSQAVAHVKVLLAEVKRLNYHLGEAESLAEGWDRIGERIAHFIPEHYEAGYAAHEDWAKDAADVVNKAQAWRKRGRTEEDADRVAAAVEKIYPSEDFA